MTRTAVLFAALLTSPACAIPVSQSLVQVSRGEFRPGERVATWDRALVAYQETNLWIGFSDGSGGVLVSGPAHNNVACGETTCSSVETYQLTLCSTGTALLRVNRTISGVAAADLTGGSTATLTDQQKSALKREQDALLARILGEEATTMPAQRQGGKTSD